MIAAGRKLRELRALRHDPPGYAKQGARRTTFQFALEQCEQFLAAAADTGYATRPVQLFYALSQASRAIVAASPRIGNQAWNVSGHGLTANTNATIAADVRVSATKSGLFPAIATAIDAEALVTEESISLRDLWPLLPETAEEPLTDDVMFPALLFSQEGWPKAQSFAQAEIHWIPPRVRELYGQDQAKVTAHSERYPSLRGSLLQNVQPLGGFHWRSVGPGMSLRLEWRDGTPPLMLPEYKTMGELGVARYRSQKDYLVTPAIGSMSTGLHPLLALWSVLLSLASLARYAPAGWSKMIDIDRSAEANSIEHFLDEASASIPAAVVHQLETFH